VPPDPSKGKSKAVPAKETRYWTMVTKANPYTLITIMLAVNKNCNKSLDSRILPRVEALIKEWQAAGKVGNYCFLLVVCVWLLRFSNTTARRDVSML
jgi:hypothetical protein